MFLWIAVNELKLYISSDSFWNLLSISIIFRPNDFSFENSFSFLSLQHLQHYMQEQQDLPISLKIFNISIQELISPKHMYNSPNGV